MSPPEKPVHDDRMLLEYLLGTASAEETEHFDELSVVDEEFAWRLAGVESDLIDAYVRGELHGKTLGRFESVYLSSAKRRERVEFAKSLAAMNQRAGGAALPASYSKLWLGFPRWATAVACVVVVSSTFVVLRGWLDHRANPPGIPRPTAEVAAPTPGPAGRAGPEGGSVPAVVTPAVVLLPQTRGSSRISEVALTSEIETVSFRLRLESDDFVSYQVALKDAANVEVWRSGMVKSVSSGSNSEVRVSFSVSLLKGRSYTLELSSAPANSRSEFVDSYAFQVVRR
jgi:hypothetical protein